MNSFSPSTKASAEVLRIFTEKTGLTDPVSEVRDRPDGRLLVILIAHPNERHYAAANEIGDSLPADHPFAGRIAVAQRKLGPVTLADPEARLLQRTLASAVTSDRHSFKGDFFQLYIRTASRAEEQVLADGNHIVFGRRGAGKSSLLVYAMRTLEQKKQPFAWVDMQTYAHRTDNRVILDVIGEILQQVAELGLGGHVVTTVLTRLKDLQTDVRDAELDSVRRLAPELKALFGGVTKQLGRFTIFLDDLHVIGEQIQPALLGVLYSFSRGNRVSLKVSALEHFTRHWDASARLGLEVPGDAQTVPLDYNLTNPGNALAHIQSILDAQAQFCGLRSILSICGSTVIERLVWLAAGVPRDALSILQQAMASAAADARRKVTVTDVNVAASAYVEDKMRHLTADTAEGQDRIRGLLDFIKAFCIKEKRINAFLVPIEQEEGIFRDLLRLIDLRFLHVLNRGITPRKAGEKYMALLLDYGFYTGVRRAKTVDVLQKRPATLKYQELRGLPTLDLRQAAEAIG
jgi:Cdc6-like AAA superfamily ATPase